VLNGEPFHNTESPGRNPVPYTFNEKPGPPAVAELGSIVETTRVAGLIAKVYGPRTAPPGICTEILALPWEAIRLAATEAVNVLPLT
jgi:hypothetical protein